MCVGTIDYFSLCMCVCVCACVCAYVCVCVLVYLPGRGRWKGRKVSRPLLLHSLCKSAGLGALASHWANTWPLLRNTQSHITMTTTWTHTHTHTSVQGPLCGIHHSTSGETRKAEKLTNTYQCNLSCSSGASVQEDTHTHSCPGC